MKLKAIFTTLLALTAMNTWALDLDNLTLDDCKDNADILGYMMTIKSQCNLDEESGNSEIAEAIFQMSKQCIAQYGETTMGNATRVGIFSTKSELEETGRNATCLRALTDYPELFD